MGWLLSTQNGTKHIGRPNLVSINYLNGTRQVNTALMVLNWYWLFGVYIYTAHHKIFQYDNNITNVKTIVEKLA